MPSVTGDPGEYGITVLLRHRTNKGPGTHWTITSIFTTQDFRYKIPPISMCSWNILFPDSKGVVGGTDPYQGLSLVEVGLDKFHLFFGKRQSPGKKHH